MSIRAEAEITLTRVDDGEQGAPGQPGVDGADGKSAYQSAQDGGYTGTEAAFNADLADVPNKMNFSDVYEQINATEMHTFYAYAKNAQGDDLSMTDTSLQYRGVASSANSEPPTDTNAYMWEINPEWASKRADDYISQITGGIKIASPDPATYAKISAIALMFFMNNIEQVRFGYDEAMEAYGAIAQNFVALGSGAGVKFDNSADAAVRSRFVWEVRDNGHLSLKKY